jgi:hypothetical protein
MDTLKLLQDAIENQKSIEFKYIKTGKVEGTRMGDPHAVFLHPTTNNATVDIFQTGGASDSQQLIPRWRPFLLEFIQDITITEKHFHIAVGYDSNPASKKYSKVISKVK